MGQKQPIKNFAGQILGYLETCDNGDIIARAFSGKILGYYRKQYDHTTDFFGRVLYKGNMVASFINENTKNQ